MVPIETFFSSTAIKKISLQRDFYAHPVRFGKALQKFSLQFHFPRFRCASLDCSDQTIWVAHWWRDATQNTWSGKGLSRTMIWTMVALRSDQRAKSHYILIIGRTKVWTIVALRSDQRPKSEHNVEFCIFVVRKLLAGEWLAPKTLSKFRKICLVVPLLVGSVLCCP